MGIILPLISPLSRKYYLYASDAEGKIHHKALDIRLCLECVCNEIVYQFVSHETQQRWKRFSLHEKIEATKEFMNTEVVNGLLNAKGIGNKGAHDGEEGQYSSQDIIDAQEAIKKFSLEIFCSYFVKNGFENLQNGTWIPTVFSTLPPTYRVTILHKYYNHVPSPFVIDKLSKAYLKSGNKNEGINFLSECLNKKQISYAQFDRLQYDLDLLDKYYDKLPIANNLEIAKENFNRLLPAIEEDNRDVFICLVSMVLNGKA